MSNYNTKELKWPSRLLKSDNYRITYTNHDVLMMIHRTSKNGVWKLTQYPKWENNEFVRGLESILTNTITNEVWCRIDGVVTKFKDNIAMREFKMGVAPDVLRNKYKKK